MSDRFPRDPAPPRPRPEGPGRVLRFRSPLSGLLSRPLLRWSATIAVVALGLLLTALSLRPGWFFPETPVRPAASADSEATKDGETSPPGLGWRAVEGAAVYRLSFLDPDTGRLVLSMNASGTSLELPSEAAARLAPAATCELVVEALSEEGEILGRESRLFEPPRASPPDPEE